ncbi:MAG: hypothetical protein PUD65_05590 [Spirochaetales bacterium]|nr:hypothetical protein [Spirochaetales bacterium]
MKKRLLLLLLCFLFSLSWAFSLSGETIMFAEGEVLKSIARERGVDTSGSDDEIRSRIFEALGLEEVTLKVEEEEKEESRYTLQINNADNLREVDGTMILEGNVSISFQYGEEKPKTLSSSSLILDTENKKITALGTVVFKDNSKDAAIQEINADVFSLLWEKGDFVISGGTTETERKNSEGESVSFYTTGETLSYSSSGYMLYDEGYITSNPKHAYSSISASRIAILPGEDMFLSSVFFNIGRVPIFYLPFFFYPGSRILGNPVFGFSSNKGAFVNTTFELFGNYPELEEVDESSSFSAILKSTDDQSSFVPKGFYYGAKEDEDSFSSWVSKTKSHLALLVDSYSGSNGTSLPKGGLHVALDGAINLFDGKLKIKFLDGIGYTSPVKKTNDKFRFYGDNSLELSTWGFNIKASFPFYSDQYVLRDFSSRLTGFSISPLLGEETTLPKDKSSISSFSRTLSGSWSLPGKYTGFFLSSLNLKNISFKETYNYNSSKDEFLVSEIVSPSLSFYLSGSLLDLKANTQKDTNAEMTEDKKEDNNETVDPLLGNKYSFTGAETKKETKNSKTYINLGWSFSGDILDNKSYSAGEEKGSGSSYVFSGKATLNTGVGDYLTVKDTLTPSYSLKNTKSIYSSYETNTRKENISVTNNLSLSIPYIYLTYNLSLKLYTLDDVSEEKVYNSGNVNENNKREETPFSWDKSSVKTHELQFSKSFDTTLGKFSGKVSFVLPPLSFAINPSISYAYNIFSSSFSWSFKEVDDKIQPQKSNLKFAINASNISASVESIYNFESFTGHFDSKKLRLYGSLSLFTDNKKWSIEEKIDYVPENSVGEKNWFNYLSTNIKMDAISSSIVFSSIETNKIELERVTIKTDINSKSVQFWKGRVFLSFTLKSSLNYLNREKNRSSFTLEPQIKFSIAEFLDFKLSLITENRNIGSYFVGDKFSLSSLFEDLARSMDFFGDGRNNTSFILRSISMEAIHVMDDWNLNCKYSTEIVKSNVTGGSVYTLQPSLSIFLSWKTMPDLKVEENWRQVKGDDGSLVWERI